MIAFPITIAASGILGLIYTGLSIAVGIERGRANLSLGVGDNANVAIGAEDEAPRLFIAIRRHGQFAEYVPISLLLILLLELNRANRMAVAAFAAVLVLSRIFMALGLGLATPNPMRTAGNLMQWGMIAGASAFGLLIAI